MQYEALAERVLGGERITRAEATDLLKSPDDDLLLLLHAASRVRRHHHGTLVKVHVLQNAKSDACPEDCGFCSQSTKFETQVDTYAMQSADTLVTAARRAVRAGASTYCMVTATRGPSAKELREICDAVQTIRSEFPTLGICTSLGLLKPGQAEALADAGVTRYNHNLETSQRFFGEVVSTHQFKDRLTTVQSARSAGLEACSGGIVGMGETIEDRVELAFALAELGVESVPVNFLDPRPGTPLQQAKRLSPNDALRTLAMFRFVHPSQDLRAAGGREVTLGSLQPLALHVANSIFANGYLTTLGQGEDADFRMIRESGFEGRRDG
ncbi:MAG: biotin synthase BioB [Deltaproteobacteria bacterium]